MTRYREAHSLPRLLALCLAIGLQIAAIGAHGQSPGIQVSGTGEVVVVPDLARVNLEVRREGADPAALKRELDAVAAAVLGLAGSLRIDARDVTAAAVNVFPRYRSRDGETVVDGVVASRTIAVTLRDLDRLGELVNGALERGANGVNGIELDASNRTMLERQALDLAIDDALRQAQQIAARFGVTLGPLLEAGGSAPPQPVPVRMDTLAAAAPGAGGSFEPGELTVRREISARFAIEPPDASR